MTHAIPFSPHSSDPNVIQDVVRPNGKTRRRAREPLPLQALFERAGVEDQGSIGIAGSVNLLAKSGRLIGDGLCPESFFADLVEIAEANLPLARLYEGHINALGLVRTLGNSSTRAQVQRDCEAGLLFGVWGAEGARPLAIDGDRLSGGKRFASGLGTVSRAIVTVGEGAAVRLALLDVSDPLRHHPETWCKTGMRATVSGDFDVTGLPVSDLLWLGQPGQYLQEPGFIGGVWRIAAVQIGGTLGLFRAAADHLAALGRLTAEAQVARLAPILTRALAAADFTRRSAIVAEGIEGQRDPERAASFSAQARLLTEEIGQDAIAATERAVGLPHFDVDAPTGRIARDLATYMRQAARDALMQRAGAWMLGQPGPFSQLVGKDNSSARR